MMEEFNLNNKQFFAASNSDNGEVDSKTIFSYFQKNGIVWANYEGPYIIKGFLLGKYVDQNHVQFNYQHINSEMTLMTGKCTSKIELMSSGKLRLLEDWEWTCGDYSKGHSEIIEL